MGPNVVSLARMARRLSGKVCSIRRAGVVVALACVGAGLAPAAPAAARSHKVVSYRGYRVTVPVAWPVYRLGAHSATCVRFNRPAVYLGRPGSEQRCPPHQVGRPQAILIEPDRGIVRRAVTPLGRSARVAPAVAARAPTRASAAAGGVYTGLGVDPCSAPSLSQMQAWGASPYRAIGVYLGGADMACSQPNLTSAWVAQQAAAGWRLIPTYVGLQAPTNSCGCNAIVPRHATAEGTAAAQDAITHAQAVGLGAGNPIYFDMEAYPLNTANSSAVGAFLTAWTTTLHAAGYLSGVYSSSDSGITDLVAKQGTSFVEPDDIWIASWNGAKSTSDPNVPSTGWASHQRLHQYAGGHTETWGKVSLDIDSDYLDGSTASASVTPAAAPTLRVSPQAAGTIALHAGWIGQSAVSAWQVLAGDSATALAPYGTATKGGPATTITVHSQFAYFQVQALNAARQVLGITTIAITPPHLAIFGRSAFVRAHGLGAVPIGCYVPTGCTVLTTISSGQNVIARAGTVSLQPGTGGLAYFKLTSSGRTLLAQAPGSRLSVRISASEASQPSGGTTTGSPGTQISVRGASVKLNLVPFTTSGSAPPRTLTDAPALKIVSATAFAYRDRVGGVLVDCLAATPCTATVTITRGGTTIAQTGAQQLGASELGYLSFKLTPQGRNLLAGRRGNQLGARISIAFGTATSGGRIVLVGYR
jgi:Domain of unknown function (DUF1906)